MKNKNKNPLLEVIESNNHNELPEFSQIKAEHVVPAIKQVLAENKKALDDLCNTIQDGSENKQDRSSKLVNKQDVIEFLKKLEVLDNRLQKVWSPVKHLNAVMNSKAIRQAYTTCLPLLSEYSTETGQHRGLFKQFENIKKLQLELPPEVERITNNYLKKIRLSGIDLADDKQQIYKEMSTELSALQSTFADNVLDDTQAWSKLIKDDAELQGLPESAMSMLKNAAQQKGEEGYLVTLDFPVYVAIMTYADNRKLREELYKRYTTRASDQVVENNEHNNGQVMEQIVNIRTKRAQLLGFNTYAEQSLFTKMAETPEQVVSFLTDVLEKVKLQADKEIAKLKEYAQTSLSLDTMEVWDQAYVAEKVKQQELDYTEEMIKPWFSVNYVLDGLFRLVEQLYGYQVQEKKQDVDRWHEDVRFYEIINTEKETIARFYLDLYARDNKRSGAWMDSFCGRHVDSRNEQPQIPVAYMTCNLTPPGSNGEPAQFTHNEVITLFHELGHGLHHMLTKVEYLDISGINGVEWDAVELPSQFMENWCWEKDSLDLFAHHYKTGEAIPDSLYRKMLKTRHFNSALGMIRQIEFALFDMKLHQQKTTISSKKIARILDEVRELTSVLPVPEFNRFQNSFSHIFAGGYAAGYYSYLWAEVLSADAFAKFEENGLFDRETADSFLHEILEQGGSRPAQTSFTAFRGREADINALLRHSGIH